MRKSELKKILKPLIEECVKETIFESGVLSGIITEVARGMSAATVEQPTPPSKEDPLVERMKQNAFNEQQSHKLQEHKSKLMSAIGGGSYNGVDLFEGTTPTATQASPQQMAAPLAGHASDDPGVDISNLFGTVGRNWNAHMNEVKAGK